MIFAEDDGVVLPAEWYFGRWAQGAQINITKSWQNGTASREWGDGSYTGSNYRLVADDIFRDYLIVSHDSKATVTSQIYAYCRPNPVLQVGIEPISLVVTDQSFYPTSAVSRYRRTERKDFHMGWRLDWVSASEFELSEEMARFQYFVDTVAAPGQWLVRANGGIEPVNNKSIEILSPGDSSSGISTRKSEYFPYSARAKVHYGLAEHIYLGLRTEFMSHSASTEKGESAAPDWIEQVRYDDQDRKAFNIEFEPVIRPLANVYVRGDLALGFDHETLKTAYSANYDTSAMNDKGPWRKISRDGYSGSIGVDYISKGEFNSQIVLNDFNDFYRGQLFTGQFHGAILVGYSYSKSNEESGTGFSRTVVGKFGDMSAYLAYGITSQLEASARATYSWSEGRLATASESLRPSVEFAFRSYRYSPHDGVSWDSVSNLKVATGAVIPPGQFYIKERVSLGTYSSPRNANPGFLAFHNLSGGRVRYIGTSVTTGIGFNTEILTRFEWQDGYDYGDTEHWYVAIRSHLISRIQLQLEGNYYTVEGRHAGIEPLFYGHLTVLL